MFVRAVDDKASDTLVVVSGEGFWTGSSTLPHLHQPLVDSSEGDVTQDNGFGRMRQTQCLVKAGVAFVCTFRQGQVAPSLYDTVEGVLSRVAASSGPAP